jgi:hypothetical protein
MPNDAQWFWTGAQQPAVVTDRAASGVGFTGDSPALDTKSQLNDIDPMAWLTDVRGAHRLRANQSS